ncbi:mannitol dehydrogenase family protein [Paraburkholderia kururiensis]|uniref:Mannitol dehydrogenase family protein n=1 Tax=Paraburkholderia kururiensis TaxID=984307 RepID=A0ABZ0WV84_9BURK|nr:mannitol dehydrogenase family protein [Paraburkholderia kururiensis]WQD81171.1 mannitol dehydrogenase family protein [Paraburkholderia kururiensis]
MRAPILQFGTSRFLQAHAALFVSEALARDEAMGGIAVVQTTNNPVSRARIAALASGEGYPVRIRGMESGAAVDRGVTGRAIRRAWIADEDWPAIRRAAIEDMRVIVSNTGDTGYRLDERDGAPLLAQTDHVPRSFPAKLLVLLHARWAERAEAPVSLFPCELVANNGDTLRDLVIGLARQWQAEPAFVSWLATHCVWANSLVDRIVSEAIDPVGAVAEPYALWAIERQPRLELPCTHPAIVLTDDLKSFEQLKLFFLNLGHTWLAEQWLVQGRRADETVFEAMNDDAMRASVEAAWWEEVMPVFAAMSLAERAEQYVASVRERFLNPFLRHRLADIAQNHAEKVRRRMVPVVALAQEVGADAGLERLKAVIARVEGA